MDSVGNPGIGFGGIDVVVIVELVVLELLVVCVRTSLPTHTKLHERRRRFKFSLHGKHEIQ